MSSTLCLLPVLGKSLVLCRDENGARSQEWSLDSLGMHLAWERPGSLLPAASIFSFLP